MDTVDGVIKTIKELGLPVVLVIGFFYIVFYKLIPLAVDKMEQKDKVFTDTMKSVVDSFKQETKEFRTSIDGLKDVIHDLINKIEQFINKKG